MTSELSIAIEAEVTKRVRGWLEAAIEALKADSAAAMAYKPEPKQWITVQSYCKHTGTTIPKAYTLVRRGTLKSKRINGRIHVAP